MKKVLFLLLMIQSSFVFAETGPVSAPLKVTYMYSSGSLYIRFSTGSMPGCHGNNSGRLHSNNLLYDQLYSQILTMVATGGIKGQVVYTVVNSGAGQWSDCKIDGLVLYPK